MTEPEPLNTMYASLVLGRKPSSWQMLQSEVVEVKQLRDQIKKLETLLKAKKTVRQSCCQTCAGTPQEASCQHCWQHATEQNPVLYKDCLDAKCIQRKERAAMRMRRQ